MPRPRSDIRPRILQVALRIFGQKGVDGATLRAIARDADTNIGMIYYYFSTKDELFFAVVEEAYEGILQRLRDALNEAESFDVRLELLFGFLGSFDDHELSVLRLIVREALASHERMEKLVQRFLRGHVPLLVALVRQGFEEGALDRQSSPFLALSCLAGLGIAPHLLASVVQEHAADLGVELPDLEKLPELQARLYLRALGAGRAARDSEGDSGS